MEISNPLPTKGKSIVSGRVLSRKRKGARITVEWESAEMP